MRRTPTTIASFGLAFAVMLSVAGLLGASRSDPTALVSSLVGFLPAAGTTNASARTHRTAPPER